MPSKIWAFDLEDGAHEVELEFSHVSARERFYVDGKLLSDEVRWTLFSRYDFQLGSHDCVAILRVSLRSIWPRGELRIDGRLVEMLPSKSLLRPAEVTSADGDVLLRASSGTQQTAPDQLLRPTE